METTPKDTSSAFSTGVATAITAVRNGATRLRNSIIKVLPGERPEWLVLELTGTFPARKAKRKMLSPENLMGAEKHVSQEELVTIVTALCEADWLKGVVVRIQDMQVDWAGAYAVRRQLQRLKDAGKQVVATASQLGNTTYFVASAANQIVLPESGELGINGTSVTATYKAKFLARFGISFDKLAIKEYKSAGDDMVRESMSDGQREQLNALLDSLQATFAETVGQGRSKSPDEVKAWVDTGVSSANQAAGLGMIDRVAYEDELLTKAHRLLAAGAMFLTRQVSAPSPKRVAVVSLQGSIITGKSRKPPVPLPIFGDRMAGSETLVRALRAAGKDKRTAAVVFHVDSGGGSALASDLMWREVKLLAQRMPVVAVMGSVAASGGYYVLTHATKVVAAPGTITGSIGVLTLKPVLEEFNAKYGFTPETIKRGKFADLYSASSAFNDEQRAQVQRYIDEVYGRFVARVADGRGLTPERVNEIGRGRIWSGVDALEIGLVDELGDVASAIELAKSLASLPKNAPVWNVPAPQKYVLPVGDDAESVLAAVAPLFKEKALMVMPWEFTLR